MKPEVRPVSSMDCGAKGAGDSAAVGGAAGRSVSTAIVSSSLPVEVALSLRGPAVPLERDLRRPGRGHACAAVELAGEAGEGVAARITGGSAQLELDLHEPVVFGVALAPRERSGLDLPAAERDAQIGDGRVLGLARAVGDDGGVARPPGELDGRDGLRERADLIHLDEHGVADLLADPALEPLDVRHEDVVANELEAIAQP